MDKDIFRLARLFQARAHEISIEAGITAAWQSVGATVNTVGSLRTGLLIKNRDIDFHVYTNPFSLAGSFEAMAKIGQNNRIRRIAYENRLDTEEECVEWHAWYLDKENKEWQIDIIHIRPDSVYAGYFETEADRLAARLSLDERQSILEIKNSVPDGKKLRGTEIYKAVLENGVKDYKQMLAWKRKNKNTGFVSLNI